MNPQFNESKGDDFEQNGNRELAPGSERLPLALTLESRDWHRQHYKKLLQATCIMGVVCCASLLGNILQFVLRPHPVYFAQTTDNRLMPMPPLNEPYITNEGILSWAVETVIKTFSLDFNHWQQDLMEVQPQFTPGAFAELAKSLKAAQTVDLVVSKRLSMTTINTQAPIIAARGINQHGRYAWRLNFPVLITYESSQGVVNVQKLMAHVTIERVSTLDNVRGIQISQLLLKQN